MSGEMLVLAVVTTLAIIVGGSAFYWDMTRPKRRDPVRALEKPERGARKFSPWFGHYVEVVTYRSDDDWSFRVVGDPRYPGVYAAQSKFSWLPERGPNEIGLQPGFERLGDVERHGLCGQSVMPASKAAEGWWCSREKGHEGPCAAHSTIGTPSEYIEREAKQRGQ